MGSDLRRRLYLLRRLKWRTLDASDHHALSHRRRRHAAGVHRTAARNWTLRTEERRCAGEPDAHAAGQIAWPLVSPPSPEGRGGQELRSRRRADGLRAGARWKWTPAVKRLAGPMAHRPAPALRPPSPTESCPPR